MGRTEPSRPWTIVESKLDTIMSNEGHDNGQELEVAPMILHDGTEIRDWDIAVCVLHVVYYAVQIAKSGWIRAFNLGNRIAEEIFGGSWSSVIQPSGMIGCYGYSYFLPQLLAMATHNLSLKGPDLCPTSP
jgi:hypothetical protein